MLLISPHFKVVFQTNRLSYPLSLSFLPINRPRCFSARKKERVKEREMPPPASKFGIIRSLINTRAAVFRIVCDCTPFLPLVLPLHYCFARPFSSSSSSSSCKKCERQECMLWSLTSHTSSATTEERSFAHSYRSFSSSDLSLSLSPSLLLSLFPVCRKETTRATYRYEQWNW